MIQRYTRISMALAIILAVAFLAAPQARPTHASTSETYIVLYAQHAVPADAASTISAAGGNLVASYEAIGVVVARSSSASFPQALLRDSRIEGVAGTSGFGSALDFELVSGHDGAGQPGDLPNAPATDADTFSALQWDMRQIKASEAHAITGGSPAVVAGIIDTGVEPAHPDLIANIDLARSVSCESGAPDQNPAAWDDRLGHGTHVAGTVAAAANGIGIVGVAPNVKIAAIKASNDDGYFFPEMVVCAFMWAGSNQIDVVNNSYFADPFYYNCRNDPAQRAIWKAEQRAILYALKQGVTVVAAAGNFNDDLAHPSDDPLHQHDAVTNACVVIPVEIPGVIGVSANGNLRQKSFYSNEGVGVIDVVAPGGDSRFQRTAQAPNGRVLSTLPAESTITQVFQSFAPHFLHEECSEGTCSFYGYLQGTSMASPHVAGVAALIISRYGDARSPQNGKLRPGQVAAYLSQTADPIPCPSGNVIYPGTPSAAKCEGGEGYNSFYGNGQVNALRAITHQPGNKR